MEQNRKTRSFKTEKSESRKTINTSRTKREVKPRGERTFKSREKKEFKPRGERTFKSREEKEFKPRGERTFKSREEKEFKPRGERTFKSREEKEFKPRTERKFKPREEREFKPREEREFKPRTERKFKSREEKFTPKFESETQPEVKRTVRKRRDITAESKILSEIVELRRIEGRSSPKKQKILSLEHEEKFGPIRLNKYISNSGICSRRDADMLIETGAIQVNGQIVTELGTKVMPTDEVRYGDRILQREKPVYLLLNKPKDYITTMEDERDRKHVLQLVKGACKERIYPVGRLDKNTTGLLLFTNDGEITKKLTHPKHGIRKIYYVELNKNLSQADFEQIAAGMELSDGEIKVDEIAYAGETKREIGITLHSGRNRIVRRIFETLGYEIVKLDRVVFAGLTKKDLPRGKYRFLSEAEINILRMSIN